MSPRNLLQLTFGDMLRLHTGYTTKVISLSNKDRAAILLGGRIPSQVYLDARLRLRELFVLYVRASGVGRPIQCVGDYQPLFRVVMESIAAG